MKKVASTARGLTLTAVGLLALTACAGTDEGSSAHASHSSSAVQASSSGGHQHSADGGQAPAGIASATDPKYPEGDSVVLAADHMPGMKGAKATVSGAYQTTAYAVSYTPTDGGAPVEDHKWVVQEELENPGPAPLKEGTEVTLTADHMSGMKGAQATIDSSTQDTVYMVDYDKDGTTMKHHKWVVESEIRPAS